MNEKPQSKHLEKQSLCAISICVLEAGLKRFWGVIVQMKLPIWAQHNIFRSSFLTPLCNVLYHLPVLPPARWRKGLGTHAMPQCAQVILDVTGQRSMYHEVLFSLPGHVLLIQFITVVFLHIAVNLRACLKIFAFLFCSGNFNSSSEKSCRIEKTDRFGQSNGRDTVGWNSGWN